MARIEAIEKARPDEKAESDIKLQEMTTKLSEATQKAALAEKALSQHETEAEVKMQELTRREMPLQSPATPPASHTAASIGHLLKRKLKVYSGC